MASAMRLCAALAALSRRSALWARSICSAVGIALAGTRGAPGGCRPCALLCRSTASVRDTVGAKAATSV